MSYRRHEFTYFEFAILHLAQTGALGSIRDDVLAGIKDHNAEAVRTLMRGRHRILTLTSNLRTIDAVLAIGRAMNAGEIDSVYGFSDGRGNYPIYFQVSEKGLEEIRKLDEHEAKQYAHEKARKDMIARWDADNPPPEEGE